jgi:hypothetical protein
MDRVKSVASGEKAAHTLSETEMHKSNFATRISHIWWLNNVPRCTIQRAVTIRDSGANSIWELVMPQVPSKYVPAQDAPDCARDYRDNDLFGFEATSGKH